MKVSSLFAPSFFALCLTACGGGGGGGGGGDTSTPPVVVSSASSMIAVVSSASSVVVVSSSSSAASSIMSSSLSSSASSMSSSSSSSSSSSMSSVSSSSTSSESSSGSSLPTPNPATLSFLAGGIGGYGTTDGDGQAARFFYPYGVAVDSSNNLFISDSVSHVIRKIAPSGAVTTFAGKARVKSRVDGTGTDATFNSPYGIAVDAQNNLYVADSGNSAIRKITPAGVVSTFATNTQRATDVVIDNATGILYASGTNAVLKITSAGVVTILAGDPNVTGSYANGTGSAARFSATHGLALFGTNGLLVADSANNRIRQVSFSGVVTDFAGNGASGIDNGNALAATFNYPFGLAVDSANNVFVTDVNNRTIRKISSAGIVSTFAGGASSGNADGTGTAAKFSIPTGIVIDATGILYVADQGNHLVRKISTSAVVTTLAGMKSIVGAANGTGSTASFAPIRDFGSSITTDASGNLYLADTENHTIRKITAAGQVTTYAGSAGLRGLVNGSLTVSRFAYPYDVAIDSFGNQYISDGLNCVIRKITTAGQVSTFAGQGPCDTVDGAASTAQFSTPRFIAFDTADNLYVTDNQTIRKINTSGQVTTLAGKAGEAGHVDGVGTAARFANLSDIVYASDGNLYVLEGYVIRRVTLAGEVTTIAGNSTLASDSDGFGTAATFMGPSGGMIADGVGNLYVADTNNHLIRKVSLQTFAVTTVVGSRTSTGFVPGSTPGVIAHPTRLAIFGSKLYMTTDNAIVQVTPLP